MSRSPLQAVLLFLATVLVATALTTVARAPSAAPPPEPPEVREESPVSVPAAPGPGEEDEIVEIRPDLEAELVRLRLGLVDRHTGLPVAASVRLWRLGIPEDEEWTAGDHVERQLDLPEEGGLVERLPAGRYRVQCDDQREGSEDPPEFVLAEDAARVLTVAMPRSFEVRLRVFDETLEPVTRGMLSDRTNSTYTRGPATPAWATPRRRKSDRLRSGMMMGVG